MAFCGNCGAQIEDGGKFCPKCGKEAGAAQPADQDTQNNKTMAILAYILFFIPLLTGAHKTSPFVKYHTNQGLVLFLATVAWSIVYSILTGILTALLFRSATWGLWGLINTLLGLLWLAPTILCILGIVNAVKGQTKPLPVIGGISILK